MATAFSAAADDKAFSYVPEIHGAMRGRWEVNTNSGDQRFQVRNTRVTLGGKIAPQIGYFVQTDFCDRGSMKILDAYGYLGLAKGLDLRMGQFRMPFGVEPFRAPANYIFSNRSFMGKQVMNYRAVGARLAYTLPKTPVTLEFGAFNPKSIGDHTPWNRTVAYSGKATFADVKGPNATGLTFSASYGSIKPAAVRANLVDAFASWQNSNVLVAGEYMYKHYCNSSAKNNHSWLAFVDWHKPVSLGMFNQWSVQGRYDGMTDHMNMTTGAIESKRQRVTLGTTLTYQYKAVHADVRLNYEKYFGGYKENGYSPDVLSAELVVRF